MRNIKRSNEVRFARFNAVDALCPEDEPRCRRPLPEVRHVRCNRQAISLLAVELAEPGVILVFHPIKRRIER